MGITNPLGVWLVAVSEAVQEGEDVFRSDLIDKTITELPDESFDDGPVGTHRVFFSNGSCDNRSKFWLLWIVSWPTSFGYRVRNLGKTPKASL